MLSEPAICNRALEKLGAAKITALTDNTREGRACNRVFGPLRDMLLASHPWNFAVKRVNLAAAATTPAWGFTYEFPLPADYLHLLEVDNTRDFRIESSDVGEPVIRCDDAGPLFIRYIYKVDDSARFAALFDEALASVIAHELAEELTQSSTKKEALKDDARRALQLAKTRDAQENPPDDLDDGGWWDSRL